MISVEKYRQLSRQQLSLMAFLAASPLAEAWATGELELVRSRDVPRDIEL